MTFLFLIALAAAEPAAGDAEPAPGVKVGDVIDGWRITHIESDGRDPDGASMATCGWVRDVVIERDIDGERERARAVVGLPCSAAPTAKTPILALIRKPPAPEKERVQKAPQDPLLAAGLAAMGGAVGSLAGASLVLLAGGPGGIFFAIAAVVAAPAIGALFAGLAALLAKPDADLEDVGGVVAALVGCAAVASAAIILAFLPFGGGSCIWGLGGIPACGAQPGTSLPNLRTRAMAPVIGAGVGSVVGGGIPLVVSASLGKFGDPTNVLWMVGGAAAGAALGGAAGVGIGALRDEP
jgi:hypothetical protein